MAPATTLQPNNLVLCFTADQTAFSRTASLGQLRQRILVNLFRSWVRYGNFLDRSDGTSVRRRFAINQIAGDTTLSGRTAVDSLQLKTPVTYIIIFGRHLASTSLPVRLVLWRENCCCFCSWFIVVFVFALQYTCPRRWRDAQRSGASPNLKRGEIEILWARVSQPNDGLKKYKNDHLWKPTKWSYGQLFNCLCTFILQAKFIFL